MDAPVNVSLWGTFILPFCSMKWLTACVQFCWTLALKGHMTCHHLGDTTRQPDP
jgi:hypothetical protein